MEIETNKVNLLYSKDCCEFNSGGVYHLIGNFSNFLYEGSVKQFPLSSNSFIDSVNPKVGEDNLADVVEKNDVIGINSFIEESVAHEEVLKGYYPRRVVSFSRILRDGQGKKFLNLLNGFTPCGYCSRDGSKGMTSEPIGGNSEDMYTLTKQELRD